MLWLIFLVLDSIYLSTVGRNVFVPVIMDIQRSKITIKHYAVILCYALMLFGIEYFIISQKRKPFDAFILGTVIYGVYDTVNLAVFNKWTPQMALIDTLWGGILFYLSVKIYYFINKYTIK